MIPRSQLSVPFVQWPQAPALAGNGCARGVVTRFPLAQRLAGALAGCVAKCQGRLERLELGFVHTLAAGAGWSTDWRLRAAIEREAAPTGASLVSLRTVDRGALPPGSALEDLWEWVCSYSEQHALSGPSRTERVLFRDAAQAASLEVIRHRVLRAAAVLERLPERLDVRFGHRRDLPRHVDGDEALADGAAGAPADATAGAARIAMVRLVARFAQRDGTRGDTRVLLWADERTPEQVGLLRDCARRLDPQQALAEAARRRCAAA